MRRRRGRRWLLPILLWASLIGRDGSAQTAPLPPALDASSGDRAAPPGSEGGLAAATASGPAAPIPGPAGTGLLRGPGWMRRSRRDLSINLTRPPCNWRGSGRWTSPRPRRKVEQAWPRPATPGPGPSGYPTSTPASTTHGTMVSSKTFSRARTSSRAGRASWRGARPSLSVGLHRRHLRAAGGESRWSPRAGPISRPRGTTPCSRCPRPSSASRNPGETPRRRRPRSRGPRCSWRFATGLAPGPDRRLEINRAHRPSSRASGQNPAACHPRPGGSPAPRLAEVPPARPRRPARAGRAAVPPGHARLRRLVARPAHPDCPGANRPEAGLAAPGRPAPSPPMSSCACGRRIARSCRT